MMELISNFIVVQAYDSHVKAARIRGLLADEGISTFFKSSNVDLGSFLLPDTATTGIEIIVREEDAERAYAIIQHRFLNQSLKV